MEEAEREEGEETGDEGERVCEPEGEGREPVAAFRLVLVLFPGAVFFSPFPFCLLLGAVFFSPFYWLFFFRKFFLQVFFGLTFDFYWILFFYWPKEGI